MTAVTGNGHSNEVPRIRTLGGANEIGRRLRAVRGRLGWSQEKLGEISGFDRLKIVAIESGRNQAGSAAVREGLKAAFGVSGETVGQFLTGEFADAEAAADWLLGQRSYAHRLENGPIWRVAAAENGDDPDNPVVARTYETVFASMLKAASATAHEQVRIQGETRKAEGDD